MVDEVRQRLGRGLAALIGDVDEPVDHGRGPKRVPVEALRPNPRNPRKVFPEEALEELAASLKEKGIVQPILVRSAPNAPDGYEIIAGERRWRAAQRAGLHSVPVVVLEVSDREALELAIIENVQRTDLNAIEEAAGYDTLIASYEYSHNDLARIIGRSRSHIANTLRLLKLPNEVRGAVADGLLSAGHARALLNVADPVAAAQHVIDKGLSVRETEALAQADAEERGRPPRRRSVAEKDADTIALEKALTDTLGLAVSVDHANPGGTLAIRYGSLDQLDALCRLLRGQAI